MTKFNDALIKYSTVGNERREIDAILVSKFDTVDEKGKFLSKIFYFSLKEGPSNRS